MDQRNRIRALVVFGLIISILMLIPTVANLGQRGEEGPLPGGTPKISIRRFSV